MLKDCVLFLFATLIIQGCTAVENRTVVVSCLKQRGKSGYVFCLEDRSDVRRNKLLSEEWDMEGSPMAHIDYYPFLKDFNETVVNDVTMGCITLLQCRNVNFKAILKAGGLIQEERVNFVTEVVHHHGEESEVSNFWIIGLIVFFVLTGILILVVTCLRRRKRQRRSEEEASAHNHCAPAQPKDDEQL